MIPPSFVKDGFQPMSLARSRRFLPGLKRPGIMIGTEGETNTGKTEFSLSAPGPGILLAVDRMIDGVLDNATPPKSRNPEFYIKEIPFPKATMAEDFKKAWEDYRVALMTAIGNPDARTVVIDGDSDSWEIQRLAAFNGQYSLIAPIRYTDVNAARRALISRLYDSGKIIIATNKLRREYGVVKDADGNPVIYEGKEKRAETGRLVRQGFEDQNFAWGVQLRHLYRPPKTNVITGREIPQGWGVKVLKCKANPSLIDMELWEDECNFASLIQKIYPHVELKEWGL
jgi:hypothetical protein